MSALLPCKCGGNPEPDSARTGPPIGMTHALRFRLFCAGGRCNASTSWCETMDLAIAAWNRRTPPPLPTREEVALSACPIGLFMAQGELCLKTEYGNNEGRIDAYIVSSGEFFWGSAPQTIASQRAQMVVPVSADVVLRLLGGEKEDG